jgi:FkbM family methyltransferase
MFYAEKPGESGSALHPSPPVVPVVLRALVSHLLRLPVMGAWMWQRMHVLRAYFAHRFGDARFIARFDGGTRISISLADHIESQIFWQGVQEGDRGEVELLKQLLKPGDVFLDVGANVGVFTLLAAKRLSEGRVHAFEPSPFHLEKLAANLRLNAFENIEVHPVGLSDSAGISTLFFPPSEDGLTNTGMASQFRHSALVAWEEQVRCVVLDEYVRDAKIKKIDVMKIDVEGAELKVLEGGKSCIAEHRPYVVMEVSREHLARAGEKVERLVHFWKALGYRLYTVDNVDGLCQVEDPDQLVAHQNIYCDPGDRVGKKSVEVR